MFALRYGVVFDQDTQRPAMQRAVGRPFGRRDNLGMRNILHDEHPNQTDPVIISFSASHLNPLTLMPVVHIDKNKITTLPTSRALRHEEIKLQVALITPLLNVKGFSAAETKAATERARLLIEHTEALGEPLEDPLLLFSVLFGNWVANFVAYNGEVLRELAVQFLALAEKQAVTAPLMVGHQIMGVSLATTGEFIQAREHYDRALALYDPAVHRALLTRFAAAITDMRVVTLSFRSLTLWMLGYPEAAVADANLALEDAREIDHASTLMFALFWVGLTIASCGKYGIGGGTCYAGGPNPFSDLEVLRNGSSRSRFRSDWQICARDSNDHCWAQRKSLNRSDVFRTIFVVIVGGRSC